MASLLFRMQNFGKIFEKNEIAFKDLRRYERNRYPNKH